MMELKKGRIRAETQKLQAETHKIYAEIHLLEIEAAAKENGDE